MDQAIFISNTSATRWLAANIIGNQTVSVWPVFKQRGLVGYTAIVDGIPVTNNQVEKEHV